MEKKKKRKLLGRADGPVRCIHLGRYLKEVEKREVKNKTILKNRNKKKKNLIFEREGDWKIGGMLGKER